MVEGIVRDVERTPHDVVIAGGQDAGKRSGRRPFLPRPARQPSTAPEAPEDPEDPQAPEAPSGSRKNHRITGFVIFRVLKRLWIPLVVLTVVGAGGLTVARLHGIFGSETHPSYADTSVDGGAPANPQHLRYEVFGPPGTLAGISYFDGNGDLQRIKGVDLPWSLEFTATPAMVGGNLAAQGDSDSIGCRIVVDGEVKAEKTVTHEASAFVYCRLKSDE